MTLVKRRQFYKVHRVKPLNIVIYCSYVLIVYKLMDAITNVELEYSYLAAIVKEVN